MSFDVTTLALAKSYTDQHGGGGGASTAGDFIIKMTFKNDDDNYTVTSCDATVEQIDAAVAAEKRVVVIASVDNLDVFYELPLFWAAKGYTYSFGIFQEGYMMTASVTTYGSTSEWQLSVTPIGAESVDYSNAALPNISTVGGTLDLLVPNAHTHANKSTLDKLSVSNGKLQYNSSDILIKSDKQEIVNDVLAALPTWTGGSY